MLKFIMVQSSSAKFSKTPGYFVAPDPRIKIFVDFRNRDSRWDYKILYRIPKTLLTEVVALGDPIGYDSADIAQHEASKWWEDRIKDGLEAGIATIRANLTTKLPLGA